MNTHNDNFLHRLLAALSGGFALFLFTGVALTHGMKAGFFVLWMLSSIYLGFYLVARLAARPAMDDTNEPAGKKIFKTAVNYITFRYEILFLPLLIIGCAYMAWAFVIGPINYWKTDLQTEAPASSIPPAFH
jgi:hypothetical protein